MTNELGKENSLRLSNDSDDFKNIKLNSEYEYVLQTIYRVISKLTSYIKNIFYPFMIINKDLFPDLYINISMKKMFFLKFISEGLELTLNRIKKNLDITKNINISNFIKENINKLSLDELFTIIITKKTILKSIFMYFDLVIEFCDMYIINFNKMKKVLKKENLKVIDNYINYINTLCGYSGNIISKYDHFCSEIISFINYNKN